MPLKTQDKIEKEILNTEEFFERVQKDKKLFINILDVFAKDFRHKREKLGLALKRKDFSGIASLTHSLKGACANIAAKKLKNTCVLIEDAAVKNDFSLIKKELAQLDSSFKELLKYIAKLKIQLK